MYWLCLTYYVDFVIVYPAHQMGEVYKHNGA
nr:MAG TPA: hypothetical protein [Caudoviricetes sp.]